MSAEERDGACRVCGLVVRQRVMRWHREQWWLCVAHDAPCGAPCLGGGVRPKRSDEVSPGVSGLAHAHSVTECGAPRCAGGTPAEAVVRCPACGVAITADLDDDGAYVTRRHSRRALARVGLGEVVWCDGGIARACGPTTEGR